MSRVYVFTHAWLSPLQKGIQAAHAVAELVRLGAPATIDWVDSYTTLILLDGGNSDMMKVTNFQATCFSHAPYETACFYEDDRSMEGMLTAVAVLIPTDEAEQIARARELNSFEHTVPIIHRIVNAELAT
tara:strand:+ start:72 stop:461 length:390 start_codon:yes stop_codon:yes gene_type:complete